MKYSLALAMLCAVSTVCVSGAQAGSVSFTPKLFLSTDGVALSSFPSSQNLTQVIAIDRTQGTTPVSWTATSDQPWLSASASGMTGGKLKITANPASLKTDHFYRAHVTVTTSVSDFADTETLTVGFWAGSTDPKAIGVSQSVLHLAANPVEPFAYASDGSSSIYEYNVYSGALVATFQNVAATAGALEVSSDGSKLFVADTTANRIAVLDAGSGKLVHAYNVGYSIDDINLVYARPFGQPAIYVVGTQWNVGGQIIAVPSGEKLSRGLPYSGERLAVTPDGKNVFAVDVGIDPGTLASYSVDLKQEHLVVTPLLSTFINGGNCRDLAVSNSGAHVYPACGAPYEFDVYNGKTLAQVQTLPADAYPANVEIDAKNRLVGGIDPATSRL